MTEIKKEAAKTIEKAMHEMEPVARAYFCGLIAGLADHKDVQEIFAESADPEGNYKE